MKIELMYKITATVTAVCETVEEADDFEGALCDMSEDFADDRFDVFYPENTPDFKELSYPAKVTFHVETVIEKPHELDRLKFRLAEVCKTFEAHVESAPNGPNAFDHQGVPHIEIDENTKDAILDLGTEGFFFPQVRSAPDHECMIVDMALLRCIRTDVDVENLLVLLKAFTDIPRHILVLAPLIYLNWEAA